MIMKSLR